MVGLVAKPCKGVPLWSGECGLLSIPHPLVLPFGQTGNTDAWGPVIGPGPGDGDDLQC